MSDKVPGNGDLFFDHNFLHVPRGTSLKLQARRRAPTYRNKKHHNLKRKKVIKFLLISFYMLAQKSRRSFLSANQ